MPTDLHLLEYTLFSLITTITYFTSDLLRSLYRKLYGLPSIKHTILGTRTMLIFSTTEVLVLVDEEKVARLTIVSIDSMLEGGRLITYLGLQCSIPWGGKWLLGSVG